MLEQFIAVCTGDLLASVKDHMQRQRTLLHLSRQVVNLKYLKKGIRLASYQYDSTNWNTANDPFFWTSGDLRLLFHIFLLNVNTYITYILHIFLHMARVMKIS